MNADIERDGRPVAPHAPGAEWVELIGRSSIESFASMFESTASMDASVLGETVLGATAIRSVFGATRQMYDAIAFTSEVKAEKRTYLEWEGLFQNSRVAGVTVLRWSSNGLIEHIGLYHRPVSQVVAFASRLRLLLDKA